MQKLADISAFESLGSTNCSGDITVFNESYETATKAAYDSFYSTYNLFSQAYAEYKSSLDELGQLYNEYESGGMFKARPRMRASMLAAIDKHTDGVASFDSVLSGAITKWKEGCYYGQFFETMKRFPGTEKYTIATDLPPIILEAAKDALYKKTDSYEAELQLCTHDITVFKKELDGYIARCSKAR